MKRVSVGITMGDPAGIGPEICLRALGSRRLLSVCRPVVFGSATVLRKVSARCGIPLSAWIVSHARWPGLSASDLRGVRALIVDLPLPGEDKIKPGAIQKVCGLAAYEYIKAAVASAVSGSIAGVSTAPINKASLKLAGVPFPGHTEMLASLTGTERYCMMMTSGKITVGLVTTHVPVSRVPGLLTVKRISETIGLTADAMARLRGRKPRLVVCGLNPHAGEDGLFGNEERVIEKAILAANKKGLAIEGPLPADTAFVPAKMRTTDAYVVMYHDQGLIPFKMLAFDFGVNVTLGLPIVRTSVDHGTAFDIAWQGRASARSLEESVLLALKLA